MYITLQCEIRQFFMSWGIVFSCVKMWAAFSMFPFQMTFLQCFSTCGHYNILKIHVYFCRCIVNNSLAMFFTFCYWTELQDSVAIVCFLLLNFFFCHLLSYEFLIIIPLLLFTRCIVHGLKMHVTASDTVSKISSTVWCLVYKHLTPFSFCIQYLMAV